MTTLPFEADYKDIVANPDEYVSSVFACLESEFLVLPRGAGFIEYPIFERGYEALKQVTVGFTQVSCEKILDVVYTVPISLVVLRAMLGFTPPEWAYIAMQRTGIDINQGFVRTLDRQIRIAPLTPMTKAGITADRIRALITVACELLHEGAPTNIPGTIHRLDKADTQHGMEGIQSMASIGVPYAMLLYERFLGRPFAGHRDSVSELIGDSLESAIEEVLAQAGISYRKTKRAERISGFDQAPDFIVPDEYNPQIIIEAKITEDDGTARDKVTRIQHLGALNLAGQSNDQPKYEVIACIGGRGFGVRREDMRKMLLATRGKVFTLKTLDRLVECTRLQEYRTKH